MTRRSGAALTLVVGVTMMRLGITGEHRRFLRADMGRWLLLGGLMITVTSLVNLFERTRADNEVAHQGHEHSGADAADGHHGGRLAWFLVTPTVLLLLVAPGPLGSFALSRTATLTSGRVGASNWPQLSPSPDPTIMRTSDFVERAFELDGSSMRDVRVTLTGFVGNSQPARLTLVRYQIACCAADAVAAQVRVEGAVSPLAPDTWVLVTGVHRAGTSDPAVLVVEEIRVIRPPDDPYE